MPKYDKWMDVVNTPNIVRWVILAPEMNYARNDDLPKI